MITDSKEEDEVREIIKVIEADIRSTLVGREFVEGGNHVAEYLKSVLDNYSDLFEVRTPSGVSITSVDVPNRTIEIEFTTKLTDA